MEAVEADRKGKHANRANFECYMKQRKRDDGEFMCAFKHVLKDSVEDELSDAVIRLLDLAGLKGIDLENFNYEESHISDYSGLSLPKPCSASPRKSRTVLRKTMYWKRRYILS